MCLVCVCFPQQKVCRRHGLFDGGHLLVRCLLRRVCLSLEPRTTTPPVPPVPPTNTHTYKCIVAPSPARNTPPCRCIIVQRSAFSVGFSYKEGGLRGDKGTDGLLCYVIVSHLIGCDGRSHETQRRTPLSSFKCRFSTVDYSAAVEIKGC